MEDDTRLLSSKGWYVALQGDDLLVTILIEKVRLEISILVKTLKAY